MNKTHILGLFFMLSPLLVLSADGQAEGAAVVGSKYRIGPGDVLGISVWREEGLNKDVLVRPDGGITFPLVGNFAVDGMTVDDLQSVITEKLASFVPDPVVTVTVDITKSNKIYVIGKVKNSGEYMIDKNVDVLKALAMAGGLTKYADKDKIKIMRRRGGDMLEYDFDYNAISKGRGMELNILLQSGDVIFVP